MKIICIGRNYVDHIKELNNEINEDPVVFMKPETAVPLRDFPFFYPSFSNDVHHEIEVVLKICKTGKNISEKFADKYFEELTVGIDFTARDLQAKLKAKGLPWELAKAFDGSAIVGRFISKSEIKDLRDITFSLKVNDEIKQQGNTSLMLFPFERIISFVSKFITLKKGDLIFTGTPKGVGPVKINDKLQGYLGATELFKIDVK